MSELIVRWEFLRLLYREALAALYARNGWLR